jgi:hypothetical protein
MNSQAKLSAICKFYDLHEIGKIEREFSVYTKMVRLTVNSQAKWTAKNMFYDLNENGKKCDVNSQFRDKFTVWFANMLKKQKR